MRLQVLSVLLMLLTAATASAADGPEARLVLHRQGGVVVSDAAPAAVRDLALELLRSSNFNTVAHAQILKQTVPAIQDRYRRVAAGNYLMITYEHPVTMQTLGGEIEVSEIVIGWNEQYADALFTIDGEGRVVAHEKSSGAIAIKLRKALTSSKRVR